MSHESKITYGVDAVNATGRSELSGPMVSGAFPHVTTLRLPVPTAPDRFGALVRPLGVYVVDLNRAILGGQAVVIVVAMSLAWVLRRRRR